MVIRPVPLSILAGSLASLLLRSVEDQFPLDISAGPTLAPSCLVPDLPDFLHWPSLLVGIGIGLILGPIVDLIYLLRVSSGAGASCCAPASSGSLVPGALSFA